MDHSWFLELSKRASEGNKKKDVVTISISFSFSTLSLRKSCCRIDSGKQSSKGKVKSVNQLGTVQTAFR